MESSGAAVLTPDVTGAAAQGRGASPAGEKPAIILVPWDPDAPDHVERMRLQRVACGWKQDGAETWRPLQREGKIGLHWIVSWILLDLVFSLCSRFGSEFGLSVQIFGSNTGGQCSSLRRL